MSTDLTGLEAAATTKIVGSDATGTETNPLAVNANGEAKVVDTLQSGGLQASLAVNTTAVEVKVGANKLANRKSVTAVPVDGKVYWGYTNAVTTATGTPIYKNQMVEWSASDVTTIFLIAASAVNVRVTESP